MLEFIQSFIKKWNKVIFLLFYSSSFKKFGKKSTFCFPFQVDGAKHVEGVRGYSRFKNTRSECISCQRFHQAPTRSRVTGMRAINFGDLWFLDHVDIGIGAYSYCVLIIIDATSNLLWAGPQKTKDHDETIQAIVTAG